MPRKRKNAPLREGVGTIYADGDGFRASIPRPRGKGRVRRRFTTEREAREWIRANAPAIALRDPVTAEEAAEFREAAALLPEGARLSDAARALAETSAALPDVSIADAVREFLEAKEKAGRREATLQDYRYSLVRLPPVTFRDLTQRHVADALDGLNPRRRNNVLATFRTFFRWAVVKRYLTTDPSAAEDKVAIDWTPPRIYTPGQMMVLFRIAEELRPDMVPVLAVAAFAGIRISGVLRLQPDAFDFAGGVITVPGYADKLRRGYIAPLRPQLRDWLTAYPFRHWPGVWKSAFDRLMDKMPFPPIRNGLRHSFASYLYAETQDVRAVASALGHLGEVETLLRSYRRLASPALAKSYFSLRPVGMA